MPAKKDQRIKTHINLNREDHAKLQEMSKATDISVAVLARHAIRTYLNDYQREVKNTGTFDVGKEDWIITIKVFLDYYDN